MGVFRKLRKREGREKVEKRGMEVSCHVNEIAVLAKLSNCGRFTCSPQCKLRHCAHTCLSPTFNPTFSRVAVSPSDRDYNPGFHMARGAPRDHAASEKPLSPSQGYGRSYFHFTLQYLPLVASRSQDTYSAGFSRHYRIPPPLKIPKLHAQ